MAGYVFISNGTKPSLEKQLSRDEIKLSNFNRPCVQAALNMGYEVFLGINRKNPDELKCELPINLYEAHIYRSLADFKSNKIAYKNFMNILNNHDIEVIHCNTPIGGAIGRICGKKKNIKKVIYTAHGFHFYKGAPLVNQLIFKTAEKIMAHWTDAIITMNEEDYQAAQKFKLKNNGKVYKVHGVGINLNEYKSICVDRMKVREKLGLTVDDCVCISAGDLVKRKNYKTAIQAIGMIGNPKLHYLICGKGPEKEKLEKLARKCGVEKQVHFLGFRTDIKELMMASDFFIFSSLQEGLPRSLMEAMACGLPVVVSKIRGNVDLIEHKKEGFLCSPQNENDFAMAIKELMNNEKLRYDMSCKSKEQIEKFDISIVENEIERIYQEVLQE